MAPQGVFVRVTHKIKNISGKNGAMKWMLGMYIKPHEFDVAMTTALVPVSFLLNSNLTVLDLTGPNTWSYLKHLQCPHYTWSPY